MNRELLAYITREMEGASRQMHELSRRKNLLQDAATRLRMGEREEVIEALLDAKGVRL